ncbi:MAG: glycosyltransferase, partial [Bacteroidales bacterium]|nr:glycosyltransferase [Bacteroidales bacterium]
MKPSNKIKIACIIDQLGTGGTERQLKILIDNLDSSKFDISLFLLRGDKEHYLKPKNISISILNINKLASLDCFFKLLKLSYTLKKGKYQVIQTFFQDSTIIGVLSGKLSGINKVIISIRDMLFWAKPAELKIMQLMMKLSDKIVVNSKAVKQKIIPLCKNTSVQIIYNGIVTGKAFEKNNRAKEAIKKEFNLDNKPIVTLVSNYNRQVKRVDLLIEAVPHIIKVVPANFIIVGDGWMRESLEKRVKELNIEKYIKFTGLRNDVENILKGSDIALNTSDSEGFSNSVMEAMRAGL